MKKILIIDDDKFLLDMYATKFKETGFDVVTKLSSEEALAQLEEDSTFDIVLLDVLMPKLDGFEFLKKVRDNHLAPDTRFIVLSNLGEPSDIEKAKQYNVDGYIIKATATPSEVVKKVEQISSQK